MTSFKSTAAFYSRYRVPYPASLLGHLNADADLAYDSLVLDLATGPGRLALALAPSVGEVVAVDAEPAMLEEGRRLARGKGIANVKWVHARAEDLAVVPGSVDLITIGEAFHRLEQDLILHRTVVTIFIGDAQYTGPVVKLASDAGTIVDLDQFGQRDGEFAFRIEDIDAVDFGSEHERRVQFLSRCGHGS